MRLRKGILAELTEMPRRLGFAEAEGFVAARLDSEETHVSSVVSCQLSAVSFQLSVDRPRLTTDNCKLTTSSPLPLPRASA